MIAQNAKDSKNRDQESLIYKLKQTDWTTQIKLRDAVFEMLPPENKSQNF